MRRKITLSAKLPRPVPPPEPVRVKIKGDGTDDRDAAAAAFNVDLNSGSLERVRQRVRDALNDPTLRTQTITASPLPRIGLERAQQILSAYADESRNCPQCEGMGYSMQPVRIGSGGQTRNTAAPCRNPACELGKLAVLFNDMRRNVRVRNDR